MVFFLFFVPVDILVRTVYELYTKRQFVVFSCMYILCVVFIRFGEINFLSIDRRFSKTRRRMRPYAPRLIRFERLKENLFYVHRCRQAKRSAAVVYKVQTKTVRVSLKCHSGVHAVYNVYKNCKKKKKKCEEPQTHMRPKAKRQNRFKIYTFVGVYTYFSIRFSNVFFYFFFCLSTLISSFLFIFSLYVLYFLPAGS